MIIGAESQAAIDLMVDEITAGFNYDIANMADVDDLADLLCETGSVVNTSGESTINPPDHGFKSPVTLAVSQAVELGFLAHDIGNCKEAEPQFISSIEAAHNGLPSNRNLTIFTDENDVPVAFEKQYGSRTFISLRRTESYTDPTGMIYYITDLDGRSEGRGQVNVSRVPDRRGKRTRIDLARPSVFILDPTERDGYFVDEDDEDFMEILRPLAERVNGYNLDDMRAAIDELYNTAQLTKLANY